MIGSSILIVDDHRLFAEVMAAALAQVGARVVGPVGTATEAISAAARERPDLVLLDLGLPDLHGFEVARAILAERPGVPIVALTASTDPRDPSEALKSGIRGFVPKEARLEAVITAIGNALEGRPTVIAPPATDPTGSRARSPEALLARSLTDREREVLRFIVTGAASRAIAVELGISTNTVRTHVQSILTKLQVHSRLEAAAFAVRHGLVKTGGGGRLGGQDGDRSDAATAVGGLPRTAGAGA